ncbi:MAG TPA: beta-ketoacyl-[acyl-carrier-protein] synthase II [Candidatus Marinimicrobia bacterium]|nr:beta-ketoacyl-[acyl-carrier-protein] synthase II [Candidatus Neomarinimicrobiota bacterium]HIL86892.1 beta-ketoacyl-[acyl-carrier-protein] synthase II [Candidatus Neomarinimicrobiota bacterium]
MSNRVVITGEGSISPLGVSSKDLWNNLIHGKSGIRLIKSFDTENFNVKIAGEITDFDPLTFFEHKESRKLDRYTMFAMIAADQAIKSSGLDSSNVGVILGTGVGGMHTLEEEQTKLLKKGQRGVSPHFIPKMIPNIAGGQIAIKYGFHGPNLSLSTACSSASDAIGMAYRLIQSNQINAMVCGGSEGGITPLTLSGFSNMKALSKNNDNPQSASKPFDKNRDGFIMSEGSAMLVLESLDSAQKRGANILAEIVGYGITNDAYHITQPHNESKGAASAIDLALKDASINKEEVSYINAHGTSTYYNDMLETQAIKQVFGNHAKDLLVSSTKSMTGHMLGATGAIEAITCIYAMNHGIIPPTINYETPDPECDLNYVPNKSIESNLTITMSNSFGFGGHNSVLAFKKF